MNGAPRPSIAMLAAVVACAAPGDDDTSGADATGEATTASESSGATASTSSASATTTSQDESSSGDAEASGAETTGGGTTTGNDGLVDCGFDRGLVFDPDGTFLQLVSADEGVCVRLERRNDGPGTMANTSWTLLEIAIGPIGDVALVQDDTQMCWYSSHHNFLDWVHVWTGSRRYDLKLVLDGHGGAHSYELHTFAQGPVDPAACAPLADGTEAIGEPIELFPVTP